MDSDQSLRSYEYYNYSDPPVQEHCHLGLDNARLRWPAFEPLSSITVLDDEADPDSSQSPLFRDGFIHPISKSPISRPPVSSIKVFVGDLLSFAEFTRDFFCERDDEEWPPDTPPEILSKVPYPCSCTDGYNPPPPLEIVGSGPDGAVTRVRSCALALFSQS